MIMGDNATTSLILKNVDTNQKQDQDTPLAEDLAWADSCLIEDPEISETNMDSLKEALLDILEPHSEILAHSANERDDSNDIIDPENFPSVIEEGTSHSKMSNPSATKRGKSKDIIYPENFPSVAHAADKSMDEEHLEHEIHDILSSLKQPFLPNYNDEMMHVWFSDSDSDDAGFMFSDFVMEPPSGDIFKVWDLDILVEEDVLVKQLKEALSSNAATGMKVESIDGIIEGIADLSLQ